MIIEIDPQGPSPIYEQLRDQIVLGIAGGKLISGEALPSVRRLAADLGINFHTVNKAYAALCGEGYIAVDRRRGAVVARRADDGGAFGEKLSRQLSLAAAEAICRGMGEDEFTALCAECYRMSKSENGGAI